MKPEQLVHADTRPARLTVLLVSAPSCASLSMVEGYLSWSTFLCSISCYRGVANILVIAPRLTFNRESDGPFLGDSLSLFLVHPVVCFPYRVLSVLLSTMVCAWADGSLPQVQSL